MINTQLIMTGEVGIPGLSSLDIQELLVWHDNNKTILDNRGGEGLYFPWVHTKIRDVELTESNSLVINSTIPGSPWNREFVETFPNLVELFDSLPFEKIYRIVLLETIKECVPHIDLSSLFYQDNTLEPCNYRMTLRESSHSQGFYVQPIPEEEFGTGARKERTSKYTKQHYHPTLGNWWVLNNWCCQHGSDWKEGDQKVLVSVQGRPSEDHRAYLNSLKNITYHPLYQNEFSK